MDNFPIDLVLLKKLHISGNVILSTTPSKWDIFAEDVPQDLIEKWKQLSQVKSELKELLNQYGFKDVK